LPHIRNSFNLHDPYRHIQNYLIQNQGLGNLAYAIDTHYDHAKALKNAFYNYAPGSIDYNSLFFQNAYMLLYYPLYIETIAHVGESVPTDTIDGILSNNRDVCIYGGGAIPELFGFLSLINLRPQKGRIRCHIFDLYDWSGWRNYLVDRMTPEYSSHPTPEILSYPANLCNFSNPSIITRYPIIRSSKIHIFQNCLTEVIDTGQSLENFKQLFTNFFQMIPSGSIILYTNIVSYPRTGLTSLIDVQARLKNINTLFITGGYGETLLPISLYDPFSYEPNIVPCATIQRRLDTQITSKYHALVLRKFSPGES
jgi:hypothetical protein